MAEGKKAYHFSTSLKMQKQDKSGSIFDVEKPNSIILPVGYAAGILRKDLIQEIKHKTLEM